VPEFSRLRQKSLESSGKIRGSSFDRCLDKSFHARKHIFQNLRHHKIELDRIFRGFYDAFYASRIFSQDLVLMSALAAAAAAQSGRVTTSPTPPKTIPKEFNTEEIKAQHLALDRNGEFFSGVDREDLVIAKRVLHQPPSVRRIPASVLIVLDTAAKSARRKTSEKRARPRRP
jgi:hypothetical protein